MRPHRAVKLPGCLLGLHKNDGLANLLGEREDHVKQNIDLVCWRWTDLQALRSIPSEPDSFAGRLESAKEVNQ